MAKVELKKPVIDEIAANIADAQSVVIVDYCGLTVEQDTRLRKELRENGIIYKVYKNTMMNFAFKGTDPMQLPSPRQTQRLRQEFLPSSPRTPRHWRSRAVL